MSIKVETTGLLLDSMMADHHVKAALLVDARGYLIERRGSAMSLRDAGEDDTISMSKDLENLYIVQIHENFLIIVFDEKMNFERIKTSVDDVLAGFELV